MLFNSFIFWIFFFIVICLYRCLSHKSQNRMLLIASYIFYGYWDYRFLSLIFISTVVDYFVANAIQESKEQKTRKFALSVSIVSNLGILGIFKYFDFFSHEVSVLFTGLGLDVSLPLLNVVLPVGISFYTFQTMSYTIDVYQGVTKPTRKFLDFALYVSFFPQLVAGPIERSSHLLPQILKPRTVRENDFSEGLYHVLIGLFKKIVIADNMAPIVNSIFSTPTSDLSGMEVLVGVYAFAFQIYGDFSGYSSIAQGIAKWMGFDLMWNFKMPYFSISPGDFWQRWHISLSSWLRDYLYIPLGGNKGGTLFTFRNLVITMLLGGLWHGAGWTFMLWGLYHGLLLIVYHLFETNGENKDFSLFSIKHVFKIILMFHFVCGSWLLFRAESVQQVIGMLDALVFNFYPTDFAIFSFAMLLFFSGPLMLYELWLEKTRNNLMILNVHWLYRALFYTYLILMIFIFPPDKPQDFIYFQF